MQNLHQDQYDILKQIKSSDKLVSVLNCGRRWGKSYLLETLCQNKIKYKNKFYTFRSKPFDVCVIGPTFKFIKGMFLRIKTSNLLLYQDSISFRLTLANGVNISFYSGEDERSGRGEKFDLILMDECAFFIRRYFYSILYESLVPTVTTSSSPKIILASSFKGNFWHDFIEDNRENYQILTRRTSDNPLITEKQLQLVKDSMPLSSFNEEMNCIKNDSSSFFGNIDACITTESNYDLRKIFHFSVDPAYSHDSCGLLLSQATNILCERNIEIPKTIGDTISKINYVFNEIELFIKNKTELYQINNYKIIIEQNGLGVSFLNFFTKRYPGKVIPVNTSQNNKIRNIDFLKSLIYNNELRIHSSCKTLISQILDYPDNKHDDMFMSLIHYFSTISQKQSTTNSYKFLP